MQLAQKAPRIKRPKEPSMDFFENQLFGFWLFGNQARNLCGPFIGQLCAFDLISLKRHARLSASGLMS
ncbi:hypothetical protein NMG60_11033132 [Bertholletia excelsa]